MKMSEQDSEKLLKRLAEQTHMTIPRNNKFLKECLEYWLQKDLSAVSPAKLYKLCCERAGENGHNAFMRAAVNWIEEKQIIPQKLRCALVAERDLPWAKSLKSVISRKFPKAEID